MVLPKTSNLTKMLAKAEFTKTFVPIFALVVGLVGTVAYGGVKLGSLYTMVQTERELRQ